MVLTRVLIAYIGGVICGPTSQDTRPELGVLIAYIGGVICGVAVLAYASKEECLNRLHWRGYLRVVRLAKKSGIRVLIAYIGGVICGKLRRRTDSYSES